MYDIDRNKWSVECGLFIFVINVHFCCFLKIRVDIFSSMTQSPIILYARGKQDISKSFHCRRYFQVTRANPRGYRNIYTLHLRKYNVCMLQKIYLLRYIALWKSSSNKVVCETILLTCTIQSLNSVLRVAGRRHKLFLVIRCIKRAYSNV